MIGREGKHHLPITTNEMKKITNKKEDKMEKEKQLKSNTLQQKSKVELKVNRIGDSSIPHELREVIKKCAGFSSVNVPVEYGYLILKDDSIIATDGRIGIKHRSPTTFKEEFVLPAKAFSKVLSDVAQDVAVELEKKDDHVLFSAGKIQTKFCIIHNNVTYFPQVPSEDSFINLPDGFSAYLRHLKFSLSRCKKIKQSFNRVYYDGQRFYASDNVILRRVTPPLHFSLEKPMFIPRELLEHLIRENPLGYYIEELKGGGCRLWFNFEKYVIFGYVSKEPFPLKGKEIFDRYLSERENSVQVVFRDLTFMKKAIKKVEIVAKQHKNRLNLIARNGDLILYALAPGGLEAIESVPVDITSNLDGAGFVAVDIKFFKEEIEKTNEFFFREDFVYFTNSEIGLESILKPLAAEDASEVKERVERIVEHIQAREIESTETQREIQNPITGDSEACFDDGTSKFWN